jgi:hypothetical protein
MACPLEVCKVGDSEDITMQVHLFSVVKLIPHHRNLRKHDHAVDRMVSPIQEFGFQIPILAPVNQSIEGPLALVLRTAAAELPALQLNCERLLQALAIRLYETKPDESRNNFQKRK